MALHDSLVSCLLAVLFILLCGDRAVCLFVSGLWRPVRLEAWRQGGCRMAGLLVAMLALACVGRPGASACLAAVALVLLAGGQAFRPFWGVPALLAYVLLPDGAGALGLLVTGLWAAGRAGEDIRANGVARLVALILLLGLGQPMAAAHPLGWVAGSAALAGACLLAGRWKTRLALLRYCGLLRPLLLLGVAEMSRQQAMPVGEESAFFALLLDLACQCLACLWSPGRLLALPVPPLPGFVIGWVGLHAALGLSSSTEGWTVAGCLLAVAIMALSLGEGLVVLGEGPPLPTRRAGWACGMLAMLFLPPVCGLASHWLRGPGGGHGAGWAVWLYCLSGGDGSVIILPPFCLVLLGLWGVLGRKGRSMAMVEESSAPAGEMELHGLAGIQAHLLAPPVRPRRLQHLLARGRRQGQGLRLSVTELLSLLSIRDPGAIFWLLFMGGVLVVLGLAQ